MRTARPRAEPRGDGLYGDLHADGRGRAYADRFGDGRLAHRQPLGLRQLAARARSRRADPVTITAAPSEDVNVAFAGTEGQRIALRMTGVSIGTSSCCSARLHPQSERHALRPSYVGTSGAFMDTKTLPATGDYLILVDPQATASGDMTLTLYDVPPDSSAAIEAESAHDRREHDARPEREADLRRRRRAKSRSR